MEREKTLDNLRIVDFTYETHFFDSRLNIIVQFKLNFPLTLNHNFAEGFMRMV